MSNVSRIKDHCKTTENSQVSLTIIFCNCTINVDERQNNSKNYKEEQKGCTINKK